MTVFWLLRRYLTGRRRSLDLTAWLSVLGMSLAVGCLVVTMAVVSGYITTLQHSVQDTFGHLIIVKRGLGEADEIAREIEPEVRSIVSSTPFLTVEAIVAREGKVSGVILEGMEPETVNSVLGLKDRLIEGKFDVGTGDEKVPAVLVGKGVAERFHLKLGDEMRVVIPMAGEFDRSAFRPKLAKFRVTGVLDFGRYDYDSRYVVVHIRAAQTFAELKNRVTGLRLRLKDPMQASAIGHAIVEKFGDRYWTRDWFDINRNLFEAAQLEKTVIFFVLLILILAASFNVTSTMFVSVMRRYPDISILRTLGADRWLVRGLFIGQGVLIGWMGAAGGVLLGCVLSYSFERAEDLFGFFPAQVYKLQHIRVDLRLQDVGWTLLAVSVMCVFATLVPAWQGSRVQPVDGLRFK